MKKADDNENKVNNKKNYNVKQMSTKSMKLVIQNHKNWGGNNERRKESIEDKASDERIQKDNEAN